MQEPSFLANLDKKLLGSEVDLGQRSDMRPAAWLVFPDPLLKTAAYLLSIWTNTCMYLSLFFSHNF